MVTYYVPSLSFGLALESGMKGIRWGHPETKKEYSMNWWEPNSFFNYDWLLTSVHYILENKQAYNFRKRRKIPDDMNLIIDSGGFQEWSRGELLNPVDIIGVMDREADIGLIYDQIPYPRADSVFGAGKIDRPLFAKSMKETVRRAEVMIKHRQNDKNKLYAVLHGFDLDSLNTWYTSLKDLSLDGWCISPKPPSVYAAAFLSCYMMDKGEDHIHILGVSSFNMTPIAAYLGKKFDLLTFDTSTFNRGCTERGYHIPDDMATRCFFGTKTDNAIVVNTSLENLPCSCPVCSAVKSGDEMRSKGSTGGLLISLHNLYLFKEYCKRCEVMAEDVAVLENFMRRRAAKAYKAFKMFEIYEDKGIDGVYDYYRELTREEHPSLAVDIDPSEAW